MYYVLFCLIVSVTAGSQESEENICSIINCVGEEYDCIGSKCYCAKGYIPSPLQTSCIKCPGYGDRCFGRCCNGDSNVTLQCWQGICQPCYDPYGIWICRESINQILLVTVTQAAMATALVLGIIATFILLCKLCSVANVRNANARSETSRLSIGSLQVYVDERLRDAPPRYTRQAPSGSSVYPAAFFINAGFVHDSTIPPPAYNNVVKDEDSTSIQTRIPVSGPPATSHI